LEKEGQGGEGGAGGATYLLLMLRRWSFGAVGNRPVDFTDSIEHRLGCDLGIEVAGAAVSRRAAVEHGADLFAGLSSTRPCLPCLRRRLQPVNPCCVGRGRAMERELANHGVLTIRASGPPQWSFQSCGVWGCDSSLFERTEYWKSAGNKTGVGEGLASELWRAGIRNASLLFLA
jgi:hypothetical protein